jgi:multimeric flavodoxin WrbA
MLLEIQALPQTGCDTMNRREFIKGTGAGLATLLLAGCALSVPGTVSSTSTSGSTSKGSGKKMKITIITGSPHKAGTSALLADKFMEGAQQAGHDVFRFNAGLEDIHPCIACDHCGMNGPCVHQDAIEKEMIPHVLDSELIAFVTPLYYYTVSSQLKMAIDRFYSRAGQINGGNRKAVLMATAYNDADWTMDALVNYYKTLLRYLNWQDMGTVLAKGCGARSLIEKSKFPEQAYQLGLSI